MSETLNCSRQPHGLKDDDCREDVVSSELWNGGDGTIHFNHLQQGPIDPTERPPTPLEAIGTTDPWGITDSPS